MKIACYIRKEFAHHNERTGAFAAGLKRHGLQPVIVHGSGADMKPAPGADLHVFFSHRMRKIIAHCQNFSLDYLCIEMGYLGDRDQWCSAGYNGLNRRAEFYNRGMPSDRFDKHFGHMLQPWQDNTDGDILLIGQVPGDENHRHRVDIDQWYRDAGRSILATTGKKPVFRPHPKALRQRRMHGGAELPDLQEQLKTARAVVVFNSNTAVDAVMAGIPAVTCDEGSMAWDVTAHAPEGAAALIRPDRAQWAADLAYAQWHTDELASGAAWAHLKQRYQ